MRIDREARVDPAVALAHVGKRRPRTAPRGGRGTRRSPPRHGPRRRWAAARCKAGAALGLSAEHLQDLHGGDDQAEVPVEREGANVGAYGVGWQAAPRPPVRPSASSRDGSASTAHDLAAAPRQVQGDAAGAAPELEHGAVDARPPARPRPPGPPCSHRTRRRARPPPELTPSTPAPGRASRAGCEARAAPCRWEGRTAGHRPAATARSSERSIASSTSIASGGDARVLQAHRHLGGSRARADHAADVTGEQLEVGVPDPGDVPAVGDPVVERDPEVKAVAAVSPADSSSRVRSTSLAPAGFLISRIETGLPATSIVSTRPNTASHPAQGAGRLLERDAEPQRRGQRGERVVDVVEAGEGEAQLDLALGRAHARRASRACPRSSIRVAATSGAGRSAPQFGQR